MQIYQNSSYPIKERVEDLLNSMTLKEKVGQLNQKLYGWNAFEKKADGYELTEMFKEHVDRFGGMGALYGLFRADPWSGIDYSNGIEAKDSAALTNMVQKYLAENTRLGIPVLLSEECPHGHQGLDSTLYPTNIGSGATWNPALQQTASSNVAKELEARGIHLGLVSALDIMRDPRWGRSEECFSEDPYLTSRMTEAIVKGMQGDGEKLSFVPVLKHFIAQGAGTGGHNAGPALIGERELREVFLPPMKAGVEAGAVACMAAYNEVDGIPCHSNRHLLTGILREEWGFDGIVMADGQALDRLIAMSGDTELAGAMALDAGVDLSLWDDVYLTLEKAVESGKIPMRTIDQAVRRILTLKFRLGMFDENRYTDVKKPEKLFAKPRFEETSLEMARQSIVLLENRGNVLPIGNEVKTIAVIGPNADSLYNMLGDYTPIQRHGSGKTVLEGIRKAAGAGREVLYSYGCGIRNPSREGFKDALEKAGRADLTVVVLGGSSTRDFGMEFEGNGAVRAFEEAEMDCGENMDLADVSLGGVQEDLVKELLTIGKPVVAVLVQGRPHAIPWIAENCDAVLSAWYPGPYGGEAVSDVLFGQVNPSGKLPVSIPISSMQLPVYYNFKNSGAKRDYCDMSGNSLYSFGYGLSYTDFSYLLLDKEPIEITRRQLKDGARARVSVEVQNTGEMDGYEVVQLYTTDMESSVTQRFKELKGFKKVWLPSGERKKVTFELGWEELSVWNPSMEFGVEPGRVKLRIGGSPYSLLEGELLIRK